MTPRRRGPGPGPGPGGDGLPDDPFDERAPWRLWDHIGVISGVVLGLIALSILLLIAAAGDPGAFGILAVIVIGVALIFFGGQLHSARRR